MEQPLAWAEIDLAAIEHNVKCLKRAAAGSRLMAVVKADGYGHGATAVARRALAAGARWLGVARLQEALALRGAGLTAPLLIFGPTPPAAVRHLVDHDLTQSVTGFDMAAGISRAACRMGGRVRVHVKVDTGMGRLGVPADRTGLSPTGKMAAGRCVREIESIARLEGIALEGIFTHFAAADEADKTYTRTQFEMFGGLLDQLESAGIDIPLKHAANSAAIIDHPDTHLDLVRAGIAMYGLYPSPDVSRRSVTLKPAMTLKARIVQVKAVPAGFKVSYGMTWLAPAATTIATVAVGYADGYSRRLSSRGRMLVGGRRVPVVGRVCMDLTMVDVGGLEGVAAGGVVAGDEAVWLGRQGGERISADEIAADLDTINYEVVCRPSSRVPRIYLKP